MSISLYQIDAFTDQIFKGNPAAVVPLREPADEAWMQNVAREMNLSETAFMHPIENGFALRWFTPAVEVSLCGHATLASAHVLWESRTLAPSQPARFFTRSGWLTTRKDGAWIEMDFPATPAFACEAPPELVDALGAFPRWCGKTEFDYLLEFENESIIRELRPNFTKLREVPVRGVIATSLAADSQFDFISRFFAPAAGVDEDPVTGSAHCALGPFWRERLSRDSFTAYQASPRGGVVKISVQNSRVLLTGQCVTVMRGELLGT